jgi:aquaporin related protein
MARFAQDIQAAFLEFIGTVMFLLIGLGGIQSVTSEANTDLSSTSGTGAATNNASSSVVERNMCVFPSLCTLMHAHARLLARYISCVMGLSLLVSAWLFFRASGGLFNPNVSLALVLTGVITPVRFVLYCIAQLLGGITASALVLALMPGPLASKYVPHGRPAQPQMLTTPAARHRVRT